MVVFVLVVDGPRPAQEKLPRNILAGRLIIIRILINYVVLKDALVLRLLVELNPDAKQINKNDEPIDRRSDGIQVCVFFLVSREKELTGPRITAQFPGEVVLRALILFVLGIVTRAEILREQEWREGDGRNEVADVNVLDDLKELRDCLIVISANVIDVRFEGLEALEEEKQSSDQALKEVELCHAFFEVYLVVLAKNVDSRLQLSFEQFTLPLLLLCLELLACAWIDGASLEALVLLARVTFELAPQVIDAQLHDVDLSLELDVALFDILDLCLVFILDAVQLHILSLHHVRLQLQRCLLPLLPVDVVAEVVQLALLLPHALDVVRAEQLWDLQKCLELILFLLLGSLIFAPLSFKLGVDVVDVFLVAGTGRDRVYPR